MFHVFGRTIRGYVLSIVLLGGIAPLALVGAWLTRGGVQSGELLLQRQLTASLDNVMRDMTRRWGFLSGDLLMLAEDPVARRVTTGTMTSSDSAYLSQMTAKVSRSILSFDYVDPSGRSRWSVARSASAPDTGFVRGPVLDLEFPVRESTGAVVGTLSVRALLNGILWTDSAKLTVPGSVLAVRETRTGRVLVPLTEELDFPAAGRQRIRGEPWLTVSARPAEPSLEIALAAASTPYIAPFEDAARAGLVALILVTLVALSVTIFMTTRLARSVDQLANAADAVSRGELSSGVNARGPVELQRLAGAFNVMTESLRRVLAELSQRRALAAVGEFAASLSHEVRNTLTPVEVDLERAGERVVDDVRTHALVSRALSQVRKLERAVTGALAIARSGRLVASDVDLGDVLRTAVDGTRSAFQSGGSSVEVVELQRPIRVRGDADALRHLFVNLLLNASQALPPGGLARVDAILDGGNTVIVSVVDDGPGMSDEALSRAGQPFFTTRPGGTGLGLPIARQIAAAHSGTIQHARANGRGTVVRVTLPLGAA